LWHQHVFNKVQALSGFGVWVRVHGSNVNDLF